MTYNDGTIGIPKACAQECRVSSTHCSGFGFGGFGRSHLDSGRRVMSGLWIYESEGVVHEFPKYMGSKEYVGRT